MQANGPVIHKVRTRDSEGRKAKGEKCRKEERMDESP